MAVKILQHQDPTKLEKLINKALADAKGAMRLHSLTAGNGMFIAVLEPAPKPAELIAVPAAKDKPAAKGKAKDKPAAKSETKSKR